METTPVTMNEKEYSELIATGLGLLPEERDYRFEAVNLISDMDENGEVKIEITGRTDVCDKTGAKKFLSDFYTSFHYTIVLCDCNETPILERHN